MNKWPRLFYLGACHLIIALDQQAFNAILSAFEHVFELRRCEKFSGFLSILELFVYDCVIQQKKASDHEYKCAFQVHLSIQASSDPLLPRIRYLS